MKINHVESGLTFEVIRNGESFSLLDVERNKTYSFNEYYEAIWFAIEQIRNASYDRISDEQLGLIAQRAHISPRDFSRTAVISFFKKQKINRTYYDQIFLKLLSLYRSGNPFVVLSNKSDFVIDHEVAFLLRAALGTRMSLPA